MNKYKYEQGQRVYFNMGNDIKGWGKVCGSFTDEMPPIGRGWIIEPEEPVPFDKAVYPFSHFVAFGCQIRTEEFELGKTNETDPDTLPGEVENPPSA